MMLALLFIKVVAAAIVGALIMVGCLYLAGRLSDQIGCGLEETEADE